MSFRKRGAEMSFSLIVAAAIAVIIIIVSIFVIMGGFKSLGRATDCTGNQGRCAYDLEECNPVTELPTSAYSCKDSQKPICCIPVDKQGSFDSTRFSTEQRKALAEPVFMTVGKSSTAVTSLSLTEGLIEPVNLRPNDKLPADSYGPVLLSLTDTKTGKVVLERLMSPAQATLPLDPENTHLIAAIDGELLPGKTLTLTMNPNIKDINSNYVMKVIVFDKLKLACSVDFPPSTKEKEWTECIKTGGKNTNSFPEFGNDIALGKLQADNGNLKSDSSYFLVSKSYPISIKPILEISGISTAWVAEDTISVKSNDPSYTELQVRLVNSKSFTSSDQIADECTAGEGFVVGAHTSFFGEISNIIGTTTETKGIPLNLNIGGFRIPTASVQQKYLVEKKVLKLINGKAEFKIDKSTMLKDFYESGGEDADIIIGENAWLCVRASRQSPGKIDYAHAIAKTPLKVDAIPPMITSDDVKISYPDSIINTPAFAQQYPSVSGQKFFYKQYPQVVIACQDSGQSGCASYDYYLHLGNFVNLNVNSQDAETALTSYAITLGLNQLFQYFASKNPESTICPYLYSNEFRANSKPTIQIRTAEAGKEQGMICIRVKDKVGNAILVWKEIYSPSEMIKRVAVEGVNEAVAQSTTP